MEVPFFDWKSLYAERHPEFLSIIDKTLSKGGFILQQEVEDFEFKLAERIGAKYAIGVSDCTNALLLGLRASGIQPGDEIILAGHSFIAAAQAIHFVGAIPVAVDLDESDWLVCPESIEKAITPRTKAIMPVHVNGRLCQMDRIIEISQKYGLKVFEDAAQAMGASMNGICAGTFGSWGTFSFYPSKTLGCFGDAGALVTNDKEIYETVLSMRNHGANKEKVIPVETNIWGTNSRLDNVHAAILSYKIDYYDEVVERRRQIAAQYHEVLNSVISARLPPAPNADPTRFDIYQNYEFCHADRDALRDFLLSNGIGTIIQWGGLGIHQFKNLGLEQNLPKTDRFFRESILLPLYHVMTNNQVDYVIEKLNDFFQGNSR